MEKFGIHVEFEGSFDAAVAKTTEALGKEGFGVLTEIDLQATLKKKLGVTFRAYKILGACNPGFAHRALSASLDVGLLLPCNVVVYEEDDGKVHETVAAHGEPALAEVARDVREKLERAMQLVGKRV